MKFRLGIVLMVVALMGACSSTNGALQTATVAEAGIVQVVHVAVLSEQAAYTSHAYSSVKHQSYVAVLLKINSGEAALNAALATWAANSGQPAPAAVAAAIASLTPILADLAPLLGTSGTAATLSADISAILSTLQAPAVTKGA